jgi:hypothetical protein
MKKQTLLESIKRMHQIIGIQPDILIETEINENNPIATEGAKLFTKLFTGVEKALVVGGKKYTQNQVKIIIGKAGKGMLTADEKVVMQVLAKDAITANKLLIKTMGLEIFGEMQKITNKQLRTKYYSEVKAGLRELLPDSEFDKIIKVVDDKLSGGKVNPQPKPKPKPNVARGGLGNLPIVASVDDIMEEVLIDPIFTNIVKSKPDGQESLRKFIELHHKKGVSADDLKESAGEFIVERIQNIPNVPGKPMNISGGIDKVIGVLIKGGPALDAAKGSVKWSIAIGLALVAAGVLTLKEFISLIGCRIGFEWTNNLLGCNGASSDQQSNNTGNSGDVDWNKYKPVN